MLQSQPISDQHFPFSFEHSWGRSKMDQKDNHRRSASSGGYGPLPPMADPNATSNGGYTPRSYTPSIVHSSDPSDLNLFQIFPDVYGSVPTSIYPSAQTQYLQAPIPEVVYSSSAPSARHLPSPQFGAKYHPAPDPSYYQPYEEQNMHDLDRSSKRVRLSPFSEYESSSSEGESGERGSTASLSDYSRSPQLSCHSQVNSARSSPVIGGYSPVLGTSRPRSNTGPHSHGGYTHLVAAFPGPVKKPRKNRRKLAPMEREQVHQLRKMGACTRCWGLKMKCDDGNPCHRCEKLGAGALCVRVHFVDLDVFSKWLVDAYSRTMMHHVLKWANTPARTVTVSHEKSLGATLQLSVYEFIPTTQEQLHYWYKDASGWQSMQTTPYAMKRGINTDVLEKYIQDHTHHLVETSFKGNKILSDLFTTAYNYSRTEDNFLLRDTLQLWTASQLLIQTATIHPSSDALDISPIPSASSPLVNQTPLPRVLSNQLDHLIERRIWQLEKQILCELQKRIFGRKREDWLKIFLSLIVLMNALERDSWRLYYWMFHAEDGYTWRHPSTPKELIEKNDMLAESLAAHFAAISKGLTPFSLDWSREQTAVLIGNCDDHENVLAALERVGRDLRNPNHAVHMSNILSQYRQGDEQSLDFLYTSKVMVV